MTNAGKELKHGGQMKETPGRRSSSRSEAGLNSPFFNIDVQQREAKAAAESACFAGDSSRERLARKMRKQFRKACIVRYAIIAECWVTRPPMPRGPLRNREIGRDSDGREEVVIVHVCDRGSASIHISAILRDPRTGQTTGLRELIATDGEESLLDGCFTNLLGGRSD